MRITRRRLIWTMRRAMTKRRLRAAARKHLPYQHRSIWNSSQRSPLPRRLAYFSNLLSMSSGGKNDGISAAHFPLPMLRVSGRSIPTCSIFLFPLILTPCLPSGDIYHIPFRPHCLSIPISFPFLFFFFCQRSRFLGKFSLILSHCARSRRLTVSILSTPSLFLYLLPTYLYICPVAWTMRACGRSSPHSPPWVRSWDILGHFLWTRGVVFLSQRQRRRQNANTNFVIPQLQLQSKKALYSSSL